MGVAFRLWSATMLIVLYLLCGPLLTAAALTYGALSFALSFGLLPFRLHGPGSAALLSPALRRVRCIAHRGTRLEGLPENSLAAFAHALRAGADMLELDVWRTADGQVVVFHDPTLGRMCGAAHEGRRLDACRYDELPPLAPSDPAQQGGGAEAQHIPLLSEVLALVGAATPLIVEFKTCDAVLIRATHALLAEHRAARTLVWFGLQNGINAHLRAFDASIPTINAIPEMLRCFTLWFTGLAPFVPAHWLNGGASVLGVPVDRIDAARLRQNKTFAHWPDCLIRAFAGLVGGNPSPVFLCPALQRHMREDRAVPTWFLGVNNVEALRVAQRVGGNAVLTDRPRWLAGVVAADDAASSEGAAPPHRFTADPHLFKSGKTLLSKTQ